MNPGERLANRDGSTVNLLADAAAALPVDEPCVPTRLDETRVVLRLDHHHSAWPDDNVVDVARMTRQDQVVQKEVVVRQALKEFRDCGLSLDALLDLTTASIGLRSDRRDHDASDGPSQGVKRNRQSSNRCGTRTRDGQEGGAGLAPPRSEV